MSDDQFTKLFRYMQEQFAITNKRFDIVDAKIDSIYTLLDSHAKKQETDDQERLLMGHQLDRHEKWIGQVAERSGTKLTRA